MPVSEDKALSRRKAAYVMCGESLSHNLIRRQVLEVIINLRQKCNIKEYYLIAFLSWRELLKRRRFETKRSVEELARAGIICKVVPIPFPIPIYTPRKGWKTLTPKNIFIIPILLLLTFPMTAFYKLRFGIELFHCRSYLSSLSVLIMKMLVPGRIKFVFDPRSDFPHETALWGNWSVNSLNFRMWKYLEKLYCSYADVVISIGPHFDSYLKRVSDKTRTRNIYNNVDTASFTFDKAFREEYREKNNLGDRLIFCFSGSIYKDFWNDPKLYVQFMRCYARLFDYEARFLFLVPEYCREPLLEVFDKCEIDREVLLVESPGYCDIPRYLSIADIGLYFLSYYSPRVGVKFVEYCSVGLPTIVNDNVGGASQLVRDHKLGCSLNGKMLSDGHCRWDEDEIRGLRELIEKRVAYRDRCREFATLNCDNSMIVQSYSEVYQSM